MADIKTIGISMRVVTAAAYDEPRDALAHDWYDYLDWLLGDDARWLLIPNLGAEAVSRFVRQHRVDGLILSGGNDIGDSPLRDETEQALIRYALANHLPLVGICRGLQLLWRFFGGSLKPVESEQHIATRHQLYPIAEFSDFVGHSNPFEVNSFHGQGLSDVDIPAELAVVATTQDKQIEAVIHKQANILGLMWHPEREKPYAESDRRLMRTVLLGETE